MTVVNYIIPYVLSIIGQLENWDFASETLYADLWKNYFTSMLNIVFFMVLQVRDFGSDAAPLTLGLAEKNINCKEDNMTDNLLKLFIAEIVLRYGFYLYWNVHWKVKSWTRSGFDWRTEFELSDEFVWVCTLYCEVWLCIPMYPVMCVVGLLTIYLHSRFLIYRLQHQKKQPLSASNDMGTGSLMNMYVTFTFGIAFAFIARVLLFPSPRHKYVQLINGKEALDPGKFCGPFKVSAVAASQEVGLFGNISGGEDTVLGRVLASVLAQLALYLALYMVARNSMSKISILTDVQKLKFAEYELKIRALSDKLNKMDIKERYLRQKRYAD